MANEAASAGFRVGQRWSFEARPGEEEALLTIVKIDHAPNGMAIVHVSIEGLRLENPRSPSGFGHEVGHMPFSEDALRRSVVRLAPSGPGLPDFEEGYREWRTAYDAGKGGFFTITVREGLDFIEKALNR